MILNKCFSLLLYSTFLPTWAGSPFDHFQELSQGITAKQWHKNVEKLLSLSASDIRNKILTSFFRTLLSENRIFLQFYHLNLTEFEYDPNYFPTLNRAHYKEKKLSRQELFSRFRILPAKKVVFKRASGYVSSSKWNHLCASQVKQFSPSKQIHALWTFHLYEKYSMNLTFLQLFFSGSHLAPSGQLVLSNEVNNTGYFSSQAHHNTKKLTFCGYFSQFVVYPPFSHVKLLLKLSIFDLSHSVEICFAVMDRDLIKNIILFPNPKADALEGITKIPTKIFAVQNVLQVVTFLVVVESDQKLTLQRSQPDKLSVHDGPDTNANQVEPIQNRYFLSTFQCVVRILFELKEKNFRANITYTSTQLPLKILKMKHSTTFNISFDNSWNFRFSLLVKAPHANRINATVTYFAYKGIQNDDCKYGGLIFRSTPTKEAGKDSYICKENSQSIYSANSSLLFVTFWYKGFSWFEGSTFLDLTSCISVHICPCTKSKICDDSGSLFPLKYSYPFPKMLELYAFFLPSNTCLIVHTLFLEQTNLPCWKVPKPGLQTGVLNLFSGDWLASGCLLHFKMRGVFIPSPVIPDRVGRIELWVVLKNVVLSKHDFLLLDNKNYSRSINKQGTNKSFRRCFEFGGKANHITSFFGDMEMKTGFSQEDLKMTMIAMCPSRTWIEIVINKTETFPSQDNLQNIFPCTSKLLSSYVSLIF